MKLLLNIDNRLAFKIIQMNGLFWRSNYSVVETSLKRKTENIFISSLKGRIISKSF
jgi:hypothetical protein